MAGKVAALVRNFLQTDGDALYLVPGEKIFITRGTTRTVVGREVVSEGSFHAVVDELVPGVPAETLARKRNRLPYVAGAGLTPVEIHFAVVGESPAMMILRQGRGPAGEPLRSPTPAPAPAEIREAPASVVESSPVPAADAVRPEAVARRVEAPAGILAPLLALARERGASDVLVSPGERPLFRVHGSRVASGAAAPEAEEIEAFVARLAPPHAAKALARSGGARFVASVEAAGPCLCRAAREQSGTGLSVRLLPNEAPTLESLGLPEAVVRLAAPAPGLLLVAGPPGSGRSTTLAALAARAAQLRGERVVTVEDPVEIPIPPGQGSVSARGVGSEVPTVRAGLRAALDDGAEVVLVGSVPDAASAALVVELAASGRLVLAPAPAPSLTLALLWLDAAFPDGRRLELRSLLAPALRGGAALALCRGRKVGRVAAAETLDPGSLAAELLLSGGLAALGDQLRDCPGYTSLNESLAALVAAGLVEAREAILHSLDRSAFVAMLKQRGAPPPD